MGKPSKVPTTLSFGSRPIANLASAGRRFDRLVVASLRGRELTAAERASYDAARLAYCRACSGMARRQRAAASPIGETVALPILSRPVARSRERRSAASRVTAGRDDGADGDPPGHDGRSRPCSRSFEAGASC